MTTDSERRLAEALRECRDWIWRYHYEDRPDLADKADRALAAALSPEG